jgi:hypothetical protein
VKLAKGSEVDVLNGKQGFLRRELERVGVLRLELNVYFDCGYLVHGL